MAEKNEIAGVRKSTWLMFAATTLATIFVVVGIIRDDTPVQTDTISADQSITDNGSSSQTNEAQSELITYQGEAGKTVLELLAENSDATIEDSSFGKYVSAINGNDGDGSKYWLFYVNGEPATVGAGEYVTEDDDEIEWRLE